jgi:hypothetical protein
VALLLVVALLATALIALTSRPRHGLAQSLPTATTAVSATQTPALATATSVLQPSPTDVPTAMPTASPTAGDTPELTVNPANPPPSPAVCANSTAQFTVSNTGGGTLEWTATASDPLYALDPSSGTLASGDAPQTVSVSHIMLSGTISVTDPNANGSPQTVTITCA